MDTSRRGHPERVQLNGMCIWALIRQAHSTIHRTANAIGVTDDTLSHWIGGRRADVTKAKCLAEYLNVPLAEIVIKEGADAAPATEARDSDFVKWLNGQLPEETFSRSESNVSTRGLFCSIAFSMLKLRSQIGQAQFHDAVDGIPRTQCSDPETRDKAEAVADEWIFEGHYSDAHPGLVYRLDGTWQGWGAIYTKVLEHDEIVENPNDAEADTIETLAFEMYKERAQTVLPIVERARRLRGWKENKMLQFLDEQANAWRREIARPASG